MSSEAERQAVWKEQCEKGDPKLFDHLILLDNKVERMQETNKTLLRKLKESNQDHAHLLDTIDRIKAVLEGEENV